MASYNLPNLLEGDNPTSGIKQLFDNISSAAGLAGFTIPEPNISSILGTSIGNTNIGEILSGAFNFQENSSHLVRAKMTKDSVISRMTRRGDPQLSNTWHIQLPSLSGDYVEECSFSFWEFQPFTLTRNDQSIALSGPKSVGSMRLVFYENYVMTVTAWLNAWAAVMSDKHGNRGLPIDYFKTIYFYPLTVDNVPVAKIALIGCWPIQLPALNWHSGQSEALRLSVTFNVNRILLFN